MELTLRLLLTIIARIQRRAKTIADDSDWSNKSRNTSKLLNGTVESTDFFSLLLKILLFFLGGRIFGFFCVWLSIQFIVKVMRAAILNVGTIQINVSHANFTMKTMRCYCFLYFFLLQIHYMLFGINNKISLKINNNEKIIISNSKQEQFCFRQTVNNCLVFARKEFKKRFVCRFVFLLLLLFSHTQLERIVDNIKLIDFKNSDVELTCAPHSRLTRWLRRVFLFLSHAHHT